MSFWPLFSTMRRRSSFLMRPATTCGTSGWCTWGPNQGGHNGTGDCNQNMGSSWGCTGNYLASGWSGYNCPHNFGGCANNRDACAAACSALGIGATCYKGAFNGGCPSCACYDGVRFTHANWSGYDFAANCS